MSIITVFFLVPNMNSSVVWLECVEMHTILYLLCTNSTLDFLTFKFLLPHVL